MSLEESSPEARLQRALSSVVPRIYANGFVASTTTGDILLLLENNGTPAAVLNLSFTVAKSIAIALGQAIGQLEEVTKREMLTTSEVEAKLNEVHKK